MMSVQESLKQEYIKFAKIFGYVPELPTSSDEVLKEFGEVEDTELSPLGRAMKRALLLTTASEREYADGQLDPTGYNSHLKEVLSSKLISDSIIERIYCAEFPTSEFNACARKAQHGYLCLLNEGLRSLIFQLSVAASSRLGAQDSPDFKSILYHIGGLCHEYLTGQRLGSDKTSNDLKYSIEALKIGGNLSGAMRTFVLAHEVAHIQLGHLDNGEMKALPTPLGNVEIVEKKICQEFEADALAQEILLAAAPLVAPRSDGRGSMLYIGGGIFFLTVEMIVSECRRIFLPDSTPQINKTHPAPKDRIDALHRIIQRGVSQTDWEALNTIEKIFGDVYESFAQVPK